MSAHRLLLSLLTLLLLALSPALGKTADAYFHGGAYKYVAGKHQEALIEVEEGLSHYPDDKALQQLAEQIRKMKDNQDPSKNKQDGKGDDKKKNDKGDDKKDPNKDKKDGDKKPDENKDKKDKKDDPKDSKDPKEDDKDKQKGKNPAGAPPPGQMSEEEAKRLLNSFADDEKKEQRERQKLLRKRLETDQDW
jgi:Ca-activated chloride channel family protein